MPLPSLSPEREDKENVNRVQVFSPELRLIQHLNSQTHALGAKIHHQRITLEIPLVVDIHLYARLVAINLLSDDPAAGEDALDFRERGISG